MIEIELPSAAIGNLPQLQVVIVCLPMPHYSQIGWQLQNSEIVLYLDTYGTVYRNGICPYDFQM
jgi:hypothetical protein